MTRILPLVPFADSTPEILMLGNGEVTAHLRSEIQTAARSDAKVLIEGGTGVGKEVVARLVHDASARRRRPFVAINCAALPDSLLESELFGHVRGSFTDAYQDKPGLAMLADRGTLFLDEIGEMSPRMQAVLLRFTETLEIQRVGADRIHGRVDVRIIGATNRNLQERIASGDFRQDLYYRLNVIHISVPPLCDRGADILLLFNHFVAQYARASHIEVPAIAPATGDLLLAYGWPGNVRELKNVAERIVVRHREGDITPDALPAEIRAVVRQAIPLTAGDSISATAVLSRHPAAEIAWNEMVIEGKSFWTVVHPRFMDRELTKADVRHIVTRGLEQTQGSYRKLVDVFRMSPQDYKRFLAFLYQHDCHIAFHPFREARGGTESRLARLTAG
jgi:DNA-binding NtrC family response regulator